MVELAVQQRQPARKFDRVQLVCLAEVKLMADLVVLLSDFWLADHNSYTY